MDPAASDSSGLCQQLAEFNMTTGADTTVLKGRAVAVTVTLGDEDTPESTIEVQGGQVTDYEIYTGPYRPYDRYVYTVLSREIRTAIEQDTLFPDGRCTIHKTHRDGDFTVEFAAHSSQERQHELRSGEAVVGDIETLLEFYETMGRPETGHCSTRPFDRENEKQWCSPHSERS